MSVSIRGHIIYPARPKPAPVEYKPEPVRETERKKRKSPKPRKLMPSDTDIMNSYRVTRSSVATAHQLKCSSSYVLSRLRLLAVERDGRSKAIGS